MPVIAVASIYMGATAIAAGGLTAFGTIAAIGSIVGGIGVLTGNKTLTAIGAVAGLAGGVGAFAQSQGWMASGSASSALADTATSNTAAMADTASSQIESVAPVVDTGATAVDAGTSAAQVVDQTGNAAGLTQGATAANITQGSELAGSQGGLINAGATPNASVLGNAPGALTKAQLDGTAAFGANSVTGAGSAAAPGGSIFDTLKGGFNTMFRNSDGTLNKDMLSMAGQFVGGMFDEKKQAETDYLNAQAAMLNQQMANASDVPHLNMGLNGQVKFNAKPKPYQRPGLMNAR